MKLRSIFLVSFFFVCAMATGTSAVHAQTVPPQAANQPVSTTLSENWSGYSVSGNTYTSITGTWTVPTVTASQSVAADATWVGIGGAGSKDLIQAGTEAITEQGRVAYQAWYELLPDDSTPLTLSVSPGDSITTTITETSTNVWEIMITDNTTGARYAQTVNYASSHSSAEWIQEMPSDANGFLPLDTFSPVTFSDASVVVNGMSENIAQSGATAITLVNGHSILAAPSAVTSDGAGFTVTRSALASGVAPRTIVRRQFVRGPQGNDRYPNATSTSSYTGTGSQWTPAPGSGISGQQIQQIIQMMTSGNASASALLQQLMDQQSGATTFQSSNTGTQTYHVGPWTVRVTSSTY